MEINWQLTSLCLWGTERSLNLYVLWNCSYILAQSTNSRPLQLSFCTITRSQAQNNCNNHKRKTMFRICYLSARETGVAWCPKSRSTVPHHGRLEHAHWKSATRDCQSVASGPILWYSCTGEWRHIWGEDAHSLFPCCTYLIKKH
jgi:hypothetical protein